MLTIVTDMFLTDSFLIKGEVERKYARLSHMLDEYRKYFLKVRNATLIDLNTCDRIQTPLNLRINLCLLPIDGGQRVGQSPVVWIADQVAHQIAKQGTVARPRCH